MDRALIFVTLAFVLMFFIIREGKRLTKDERERLEWYSGDYDDCFDPELLDLDACVDAAEALNED